MNALRSFASDNNAGAHPKVLEALAAANRGHVPGYGDDPCTRSAMGRFRDHFGKGAEVFPVFNGTAANVLALRSVTRSHEAVLCAESAHINVDECGAPESWIGCKLLPIPTPDGKLTPRLIEAHLGGVGDQHHVQPRVISIAQATELGTVYRPREIETLARFVHSREMFLHMDGARLSNAAASLGLSLQGATRDLGVDVLSFGGTKNGLVGADAVILFDPRLAADFRFLRKQAMQLASKMRFLSVQLETLLTDDLWRANALHANRMAQLLARRIRRIPGIKIVQKVESNGVFVRLPRRAISKLLKRSFFYVWNEEASVVRWMCSFDTTEGDVLEFARLVARTVGR